MYYIGLDVHKKTISYCVKDASGQVHQEGKVGATRWERDRTAFGTAIGAASFPIAAFRAVAIP
jgi:hypothetical protein